MITCKRPLSANRLPHLKVHIHAQPESGRVSGLASGRERQSRLDQENAAPHYLISVGLQYIDELSGDSSRK